MAESGRSPSAAGNRTALKQSLSVDNACIFEMEGLDFEDDSISSNPINKSNNLRTACGTGRSGDPIGNSVDNNDNHDSDDDDNININRNNKMRNVKGYRNYTDEEEEDKGNEDDDRDDDDCDQQCDVRNMFDRMNLNSAPTRQFATSLPIQVPLWKTSSLNQETDDEVEQNINFDKDPMKIAESLRALAWSVKDGTEMFGDLPRHRLKSRPI